MKRLSCFLIIILLITSVAIAEKTTVWTLCQPGSYVNIRARASGRSDSVGYAECGDSFETDGKTKNGFIHVYAPVEEGEGWISKGYIVEEKPVFISKKMSIAGKGRVNARRTVGGKRRCWVQAGETVMVYWMAEWAITNKGFIKAEFLE